MPEPAACLSPSARLGLLTLLLLLLLLLIPSLLLLLSQPPLLLLLLLLPSPSIDNPGQPQVGRPPCNSLLPTSAAR
jgi:hypothetical protein